MLFNSVEFVFFFVFVFAAYYFLFKEKTKAQNILLLVASYGFYAWADWKILPLLIVSTLIFYGLGIAIFDAQNEKKKSLFTTLGVVFGIAVLGYFKYTNFFISSFKDLFESVGLQTNLHTFNIIVPIGISFYTFRLLSYVIDINRGKYEPTRNIVNFATYVAFFPSILSGPIDRPNAFIPQLQAKRTFDYNKVVDGLRQILWGLFKKIVIADHCANVVNAIFDNYTNCAPGTLVLGAVLFSFQMYADFSGYTDMAIGVARVLGFELTKNFNRPFLAQNIADFWRRWHISLTSWLTDYVFMPLNVKWRNWGKWGMILAIIVNFVLVGLWHGANWTFVAFGLFHGLLYIPLILSGAMFKKTKIETYKWGFPKLQTLGKMTLTFLLVSLGLVVFKADSIPQAIDYIAGMGSFSATAIAYQGWNHAELSFVVWLSIGLMIYEYLMEKFEPQLKAWFNRIPNIFRWVVYLLLILCIIYLGSYGAANENTFIYFQF